MELNCFQVFILATLFCQTAQTASRLKSFCYFTNWSNKLQNGDARYQIQDIDVSLCTHIIYAFADISTENLRLIRSETDDDNGSLYDPKGRYFDLNKLKETHPHLKTLLSVGGANAGSGKFKEIVKTENNMRTFSRNAIIYMRDRHFDGIDIDWEWPSVIGAKKSFTQLLQIMRDEFEEEAARKGKERLLLTVAVAVGEDFINGSYEIPQISSAVDFLNVMSYDFHGTWSKVTSFSGPLFSRASNTMFNQKLSQAWAIQRWIDGGAPPEKLIMGVTAAATSFTLYNLTSNFTGVGAKTERPGKPGPYLKQEGHVTYYRVCEVLKNGAVEYWDNEQKMAYTVAGDQWYGFGNQRSMTEKVKFAYKKELGGMMFWSLDLDDFHGGYCNKGRYPLLTAINDAIEEWDPTTTTTGSGPTTTPIDFSLHHKTNKNGINFFDMVNGDVRLQLCWAVLLACLSLVYGYINLSCSVV